LNPIRQKGGPPREWLEGFVVSAGFEPATVCL
jgi:hypothetical protein